jgi:phospholipid/cholesterol/gamma-HCH transport system substrate-binding protein
VKTETKIGIFVFLGLLSLFILSMQVNSFSNFGKKGYVIYAYINDASGLEKNAKIKLRGVNVGYLENKQLENNRVKLKLFIDKNIKIPQNSIISLSQDSMLGGKYIKIIPSNSDKFLVAGESIEKYKKIATFDEAVDSINAAAEEFKKFMHKLNKGVNKDAIVNFQQTLSNLKTGSQYLKNILAENRQNLKDTISGAKKMMVTINKRLPKIMGQIDDLTAEFRTTGKTINKKLPTLMDKFESLEDNANDILVDNKKSLHHAIKSADVFFSRGGSAFDKIDDYVGSLTKSELDVDIETYQMMADNYTQTRALVAYRPKPVSYTHLTLPTIA